MLLTALIVFTPFLTAKAGNGVNIADNKNGTVTVDYENATKARIAVIVQKQGSDKKYNYFDEAKKISVKIPLTLGNGNYNISVLKNISDNRYSPLSSENIKLSLKDGKKAFITSNLMLDWDSKNAAIKYANKIAKKQKDDYGKIKVVYKYVVTNYHYDYKKFNKNQSGGLSYYTPNINQTYKAKKGICYDIATLHASMLRSVGVTTKLITGYPKNKYFNGKSYHAWNQVYSTKKKKWMIIDPTCDMCLYEQKVKFNKLQMEKKTKEYSNTKYQY